VEVDGRRFEVAVRDPEMSLPLPPAVRPRTATGSGADGTVTAPIPGNVLRVLVAAGDHVATGDVVCILEAMKMENEIAAQVDGVVREIPVSDGDAVGAGQLLLVIDSAVV
jgi:biotin carboxyl carrier protein